jgi:hypothetical protein
MTDGSLAGQQPYAGGNEGRSHGTGVSDCERQQLDLLPKVSLDRTQLTELILGRGGEPGEGGSDWVAAVAVVSGTRTVQRPAVDLWHNRNASLGRA